MGRGTRSTTVAETMALHQQGLDPAQIAEARGRSVSTIYGHLARVIADGEITLESVVTPDVIAQVRAVVEEIGAEPLSPIKQHLPDAISYGEIQCVIAGLKLVGESGRSRPGTGEKQPDRTHSDLKPTETAKSPPVDEALFETLRQWRTAQAREQKVPPYVIFHDQVLRAVATSLPTDPESLRAVPGVGPVKLERYGHTLLAIVQAHLADTTQSDPSPSSAPVVETDETSPAPHEPVNTILTAVDDLSGLLSRSGLAKLLTGSPSDRVASYRDHPLYGALHRDWGRQELTAEVDRLIAEGYLVSRQGRLVLSPTGQAQLQAGEQVKPTNPPEKEE
jgi:hypothetical protein